MPHARCTFHEKGATLKSKTKIPDKPVRGAIAGGLSASGVFVADDFRDNLIIDRYNPCSAAEEV
jgi:hypothetical protein